MHKHKKLFKPLALDNYANNAKFANRSMDQETAYFIGFYYAGDCLARQILKERYDLKKDTLIYAMFYNYRHYIELHLKNLIKKTDILYGYMKEFGYLKNGFWDNENFEKCLQTHNLKEILEILKRKLYYIQIDDEEFPKDIEDYIIQMHQKDKNGEKFRYCYNTKGVLHFSKEENYDIKSTIEIMEDLHFKLSGVSGFLSYYIDMSVSIKDDICIATF